MEKEDLIGKIIKGNLTWKTRPTIKQFTLHNDEQFLLKTFLSV